MRFGCACAQAGKIDQAEAEAEEEAEAEAKEAKHKKSAGRSKSAEGRWSPLIRVLLNHPLHSTAQWGSVAARAPAADALCVRCRSLRCPSVGGCSEDEMAIFGEQSPIAIETDVQCTTLSTASAALRYHLTSLCVACVAL